jgi:hypothetical protein
LLTATPAIAKLRRQQPNVSVQLPLRERYSEVDVTVRAAGDILQVLSTAGVLVSAL